ncbi:MAG: Mo-dependent nitrogenase C-terminal domain-containing protein [Hydrococcus sp. C42_A2020_068]|uniref:Mo-dependent nitrogenase C-terminal domain-containing protein n=1 Tax=Pleurocapsa sp. PCC 7327 TaxID=118163 RepID=UPI00029FBF58|nr:Mo-dependent nitrogenase C-terminal domain-containing protein [Pleurocapsa sp. PCC 7327]AFY78664.1 Mo-dependent nitrogenase [Pleurocapsa sp. PCC 7327]MBF2018628.1 Mo-dependent nitrogenase C-terminal domain-containing protein [Hydrococcus sp. C42_A2020_068]
MISIAKTVLDSALVRPLRQWLEDIDIRDPQVAKFICKLVPAQCPFERKISMFNRTILYIPPLCKLNPLYEQIVGLRFKSLSYLADICNEDITIYC